MNFNNLEVFILTYNRANFLKDQLISVCEQTAQDFDIIIIDNASTDNTFEIVNEITSKYPQRNIKYIVNKSNIGGLLNVYKAVNLATKEWTCLLCDDDIIHPFYFEMAKKAIDMYPEIGYLSSMYSFIARPSCYDWQIPNDILYYLPAKTSIALTYYLQNAAWQNLISKTSLLKKHKFNQDRYGKHGDVMVIRNLLFEAPSVSLGDTYIKIRVHNEQDTNNYKTAPTKKQLLNRFTDTLKMINNKSVFELYYILKDIKSMSNTYKNLTSGYDEILKILYKNKYITFVVYVLAKNLALISIPSFIQLYILCLKKNIVRSISGKPFNKLLVLYFLIIRDLKKFFRIK